jgi:hypothetical protein
MEKVRGQTDQVARIAGFVAAKLSKDLPEKTRQPEPLIYSIGSK